MHIYTIINVPGEAISFTTIGIAPPEPSRLDLQMLGYWGDVSVQNRAFILKGMKTKLIT